MKLYFIYDLLRKLIIKDIILSISIKKVGSIRISNYKLLTKQRNILD